MYERLNRTVSQEAREIDSSEKVVEKLVFFYDDGSFKVYFPSVE